MGNRNFTYSIHKVVFLLDKLADRMLNKSLGLTLAQFRILLALHHQGEVSQKQIARFWEMTEAAVSRQTEILFKHKLVSRKENSENRREHILKLSNAGHALLTKALKIWDAESGRIYKSLDAGEIVTISKSLEKLLAVLCKDNKGVHHHLKEG